MKEGFKETMAFDMGLDCFDLWKWGNGGGNSVNKDTTKGKK